MSVIAGRRAALPAALGGIVVLTVGCLVLDPPRVSRVAAAMLVVGLVGWVVSILASPPTSSVQLPPAPAATRPRVPPLALAAFAGGATWWLAGDGVYTAANVLTWLVAVGAWLWAWWPASAAPRGARRFVAVRRELVPAAVALVAVVAVGAFMRLYRLAETPAQPTSDHAEKLLDLLTIRGGEHPIFFARNTGREPAQFYLTVWLGEVLGRTPDFELLKLGTALIGVLAVAAVWALARELSGALAGVTAALLFALSHWPVGVTRTGLRHGYGPLTSAVALWFAFRYVRTRDRRDALMCGVAIGIGLHGYSAFRMVPVAIAALWLLAAATRPRPARHVVLTDGAVLTGAAFVTTLPLLRYAFDHPENALERSASRVAAGEQSLSDMTATLATNVWNALLAFHWRGDDASVTIERFTPFLDAATGAALLGGVVLLVYRSCTQRDVRAIGVGVCALVLLLPSALSLAFPSENPSPVRLGVVAPLVFTLAGSAVDRLVALTAVERATAARLATAAVVAAGFAYAAATNFTLYFDRFDRQYRAFMADTSTVATAIERLNHAGLPLDRVYFFYRETWTDARNIGFAIGAPGWADTHNVGPGEPLPAIDSTVAFIVNRADVERAASIRNEVAIERITRWTTTRPRDVFDVYIVRPRGR